MITAAMRERLRRYIGEGRSDDEAVVVTCGEVRALLEAADEAERMRPVVEAAERWAALPDPGDCSADLPEDAAARDALIGAIAAYRAGVTS